MDSRKRSARLYRARGSPHTALGLLHTCSIPSLAEEDHILTGDLPYKGIGSFSLVPFLTPLIWGQAVPAVGKKIHSTFPAWQVLPHKSTEAAVTPTMYLASGTWQEEQYLGKSRAKKVPKMFSQSVTFSLASQKATFWGGGARRRGDTLSPRCQMEGLLLWDDRL